MCCDLSTCDRKKARAASLVEVVLVIGIIGVLISLALPAIQSARESSRRTSCAHNLKQIGVALHLDHDAFGSLPPRAPTGQPNDPNAILHWTAIILPRIGQMPLWMATVEACRLDSTSHHNPPHVGHATSISTFACPSDSRIIVPQMIPGSSDVAGYASYLGVSGSPYGGIMTSQQGEIVMRSSPGMFSSGLGPGSRFSEVRDGLSQTVMVGERPPPGQLQAGRWYSAVRYGVTFPGPDGTMDIPQVSYFPEDPCVLDGPGFGPGRVDNPCDRYHYWSLHGGGANFVLADGSVRFVPYSASAIMAALATRAGGEQIDSQ
jgi:prepilin-type processing-associated H-X9-DG protein